MSTVKITIDEAPFDLQADAHHIKETRRAPGQPAPLVRDVYIEALRIGLDRLLDRSKAKRKPS